MSGPVHDATDAAVIDVGSNSVRLVLYRLEGRAIWTTYNEKVLAGLGRGAARTGRLSPDGVEAAMIALRRFRAVLDAARPDSVFAVATAAVRESEDGPAFVERVKAETGLSVRVLTGDEEARYSALGVMAGAPDADGIVGDLGGSSLELVQVHQGQPGLGVTLPLGPFTLGVGGLFDAGRIREAVTRQLQPLANSFRARTFYAVGGAWRNLALLHMRINRYPLRIVHQYEISAREAVEAARFIARQSKGSLEQIEGISKKRLETIPHAAVVLERLIERLALERVAVSAYGLREGLLFDAMAPDVRAREPLIESCAALGGRHDAAEALGAALEAWLSPAFAALDPEFGDRDPVLIAAACRLADLGARLHPDHRADLVFEQVLRAPAPGMNHAERCFLAVALFARHTASANQPESQTIDRILSIERQRRARALGAAMRLGCDLSGRSPQLLARSALQFEGGTVVLSADEGWADMLLGEQTGKRATALATAMERTLKMGR